MQNLNLNVYTHLLLLFLLMVGGHLSYTLYDAFPVLVECPFCLGQIFDSIMDKQITRLMMKMWC
jgi:hypothetical protein